MARRTSLAPGALVDWPSELVSANISMLFADLPVRDRARAAADAGFTSIESWWPFRTPTPTAAEVDGFVRSVASAGVRVSSLNLPSGERARGDRGLAAVRAGQEEFRASVPIAVDIAARLGAPLLNLLYGNVEPREHPDAQLERGATAVAFAADAAAEAGIRVMVEAICAAEAPRYALRTVADVRRVADAARRFVDLPIGMCVDVYHLHQDDPQWLDALVRDPRFIGEVQLADFPGRGEPGTGTIDIPTVLDALWNAGYRGPLSLEYHPSRPVAAPGPTARTVTSEEPIA